MQKPDSETGFPSLNRSRSRLGGICTTGGSILWLLAVGVALLAPALRGGTALGPYDLLTKFGLNHTPGATVHNVVDSDLIQLFVPWTTLAWNQVHHGQLPLWNPYSALGMPLAFNWESAPFSLPMLVGYLVPVRFAFDIGLIVKLVLAGTGAFVFCRVLGTGSLPALFAGTVYELSGAFSGWLGWSASSVVALMGWGFAGVVLIIRGNRSILGTVVLALAIAFGIYGGYPETALFMLLALGLFTCAWVFWNRTRRAVDSNDRPRNRIWPPLLGVAVATLAGLGLSAPLWLPGTQLGFASLRASGQQSYAGLPGGDIVMLAFQGFYGLPIAGGHYIGAPSDYYRSAVYVGVTALALAAIALVFRWRQPEVVALAFVGLTSAVILYVGPVAQLIDAVPKAREILWELVTPILDFALAVLAGLGLQEVMGAKAQRSVVGALARVWWVAAIILGVLFVGVLLTMHSLGPGQRDARLRSFAWPAAQIACGLLVTWVVARSVRHSFHHSWSLRLCPTRIAAATFLLLETGFLLSAGAPLWSASSNSLPTGPAIARLQRDAGTDRVGFGATCNRLDGFPQLGILPDANVGYGVAEFAWYDPITPRTYLRSWAEAVGKPRIAHRIDPLGVICPNLTNAAVARRYGITFVLEPAGTMGPAGTHFVGTIGGEGLYRVPNVSLVSDKPVGTSPLDPDAPLRVDQTEPTTWRMPIQTARPLEVHFRTTAVPGWHAALDGRPLALRTWHEVMLQAEVPAGHHELVLHYWPTAFTIGIVLAACSAAGIVFVAAASSLRRSRRNIR